MSVQPEHVASRTYDELLADHVAADSTAIAFARANIARWLASGQVAAAPHRAWDAILADAQRSDAGFQALLVILRGQSPESAALLDFSPFAGVLPRELRRLASDRCGYRH
jgi:hypothetical protein